MSRMLYKHPGQHKIHGDMFDYIIVEESEVEEHIENGWSMTTTEAKDLDVIEADIGPSREELEQKADELGITFRANTKDETIAQKIKEKLDELD